IKELSPKTQLFFGLARRTCELKAGKRGGNKDISHVPLIGMDIDVADPAKPHKDLPASQEGALKILEAFKLPPSLTISSGRGIHAYWFLRDEIVISDDAERKSAELLVENFYRGFAEFAFPYQFDATHDIARMLRYPGSLYLKEPSNPITVEILSFDPGRLYSVEEIAEAGIQKSYVIPQRSAIEQVGLLNLEKVQEGCSWVAQVLSQPKTANYSEWFFIASVLFFAENGRELFHEWSRNHPDYDSLECDSKFDEVDPEKAKRTCESIATSLHGAEHCNRCPFRGGIHSPVDLGLPGKRMIIANSGDLPTKAASAWAATYVANQPERIFRNEVGILRIDDDDVTWDVLDGKSARHEFARIGNWVKPARDGFTPADPQQIVIEDMLETINPPLPYLKKVTSIPVITRDGRLVSKIGYDKSSQIYRVYTADLAHLSDGKNPKFANAEAAVEFIFNECLVD